MKRFIPGVVVAIVCVLALATEGQAFVRRAVEKVVVRNQPQKVIVQQQKIVVKEVQNVEIQKVKEVREVKRVVFQPVEEFQQDYHYQRQAIQIQPVQAFYRVERFSSGYGTQALSQGYSGCSTPQTQQLRQEVEQLKLRVEKQELQQKLTAPPK